MLLIAFLLCTRTYWQLYFQKRKKQTSKIKTPYHIAQIVCITSSTCGIAMDLSRWILSGLVYKTNEDVYPYQINGAYSIADLFYYIAAIAFYFAAFFKFYYTFEGTAYAMSRVTKCFFIILLAAYTIVAMWFVFAVAYFVSDRKDYGPYFYKYCIPAIIILTTFDLIFNCSLQALFVIKLRNSIQVVAAATNDKVVNRFDDLVTKNALLFTICVFTNQIFMLTILIDFLTGKFGWYWTFVRCFENLSNISALYLAHGDNAKQYKRLCGGCHKWLKICCGSKTMQTKTKKQHSTMISISSVETETVTGGDADVTADLNL